MAGCVTVPHVTQRPSGGGGGEGVKPGGYETPGRPALRVWISAQDAKQQALRAASGSGAWHGGSGGAASRVEQRSVCTARAAEFRATSGNPAALAAVRCAPLRFQGARCGVSLVLSLEYIHAVHCCAGRRARVAAADGRYRRPAVRHTRTVLVQYRLPDRLEKQSQSDIAFVKIFPSSVHATWGTVSHAARDAHST